MNFGDGMFTKLLTPFITKGGHPCAIEEVHHSIQKEKRIIDTLEPILNTHKLVLDAKLVSKDCTPNEAYSSETQHQYMGLWQLTRITRERGSLKHDDRLDALSIAVAYWVEHMSRDTDEAVKDYQAAFLDEEVRKHIALCEEVDGTERDESTWINPTGR